MLYLITAPTRSAVKDNTRKKQTTKLAKTKIFTAKTENQKLKASSNNVKMRSDKTVTTRNYFFLTKPNYTVDGNFS